MNNKTIVFSVTDLQGKRMNNKTVVFYITDLQGKRMNNKTEVVFQIIKYTRITQRMLIKK